MQTLYEFSRHITGLKNEEKYSEALSFFKKNKENYTNKQITNNEYIVSAILTCLRKTQQIEAGFIFLSRYNIPLDENQKESVLNAYGWLLRAKYLQENGGDLVNEDESRFFQDDEENDPQESNEDNKNGMVQEIEALLLLLLRLKSKFSQTLISSLFTAIIKVEGKKNNPNWKIINEFCDRYDAEFLSKECFTIQVQKKRQITDMELASAFETWYSYKTKALFKLGKWQECYSTSVKAFESIEKFHYSNELWIARRMAISKKNLGNIDDAIADLEEVLKRKKEWYIKKELAELYFEKNDMARSYGLATEAANSPGPVEFKVELLMLLGRILKKKAKPDLAAKHFLLVKLIRQEKKWKIPEKLVEELNALGYATIKMFTSNELLREVKQYWKGCDDTIANNIKLNSKSEKKFRGIIKTILNDNARGKDGFIEINKSKYYFSVPSKFHLNSKLKLNQDVEFTITPAKDNQKQIARILRII